VDEVCKACRGTGEQTYGSTSTWRGGIGGAALTTDVCDQCWGSGDTKNPWYDIRAAEAEVGEQVLVQVIGPRPKDFTDCDAGWQDMAKAKPQDG
jgi:DnaJ-class molecular chaperone